MVGEPEQTAMSKADRIPAACEFLLERNRLEKERDNARELAAMYLQCLNSRAMERGETVEQVADFCRREFEESPWLEAEYKRLADDEAATKAFCREARLIPP